MTTGIGPIGASVVSAGPLPLSSSSAARIAANRSSSGADGSSSRPANGTLAMTTLTRGSTAPTTSTSPPLKLDPQIASRSGSIPGCAASQVSAYR